MFDHVKFGVRDFALSKIFYLKALEPIERRWNRIIAEVGRLGNLREAAQAILAEISLDPGGAP